MLRRIYCLLLTLCAIPFGAVAQEEGTAWSVTLDSVAVKGQRYSSPVKQKTDGTIVWDLRRMDDMPKILGNADPVHFTQMLPGIQTNNEFRSSVNIQGSDHSHSEVSVFGVPIYNVSHLLGFFSVFNGAHYPAMSISKSPVSAAAPNKLGGMITFDLAKTVPDTVSGELSLGLLSSQGTVRLPLGKRLSLNVSLRGSYINMLYNRWMTADGQTIRYSFYDTNATLLYEIDQHNSLLVDFYHGNDNVAFDDDRYVADMSDRWGNTMGAVHWLYHGPKHTQAKWTAYVTSYHNKFRINMQSMNMQLPSAITDFGLKGTLEWKKWTVGTDLTAHHIEPQRLQAEHAPYNYSQPDSDHSFEGSLYCSYNMRIGTSVTLGGGIRGTFYRLGSFSRGSFDPHLTLSYHTDQTQVTASYAVRHQYMLQAGFSNMGLPTESWMSSNSQRAPQYGHLLNLGVSQFLFAHRYKLSADVFYKRLYHQVEYSGSVLDFLNADNDIDRFLLAGEGENYGFSVMVNKCSGKLTGWVSYSYTQAKRQFEALGSGRFPASHERPHEVNAVATYSLNRHWSAGAVFVYASGTPFTAPAYLGLFNKNILIQYGPHNGNRLKPYMRLDLSVNYKWRGRLFKENGINLSLYGATAKRNELFYYIRTNEDGSFAYQPASFLIDVLPSISYFCKF
ncbi:MAG: TonB-dependent receptor [Prevotella sp.]|nr:TonB-dependent receptor [Prevotella sp.]